LKKPSTEFCAALAGIGAIVLYAAVRAIELDHPRWTFGSSFSLGEDGVLPRIIVGSGLIALLASTFIVGHREKWADRFRAMIRDIRIPQGTGTAIVGVAVVALLTAILVGKNLDAPTPTGLESLSACLREEIARVQARGPQFMPPSMNAYRIGERTVYALIVPSLPDPGTKISTKVVDEKCQEICRMSLENEGRGNCPTGFTLEKTLWRGAWSQPVPMG
jgi:hypothetical protein